MSRTAVTRAVVRKELTVLWASPLPYLVAILFNAVAGTLFVDQLVGRRQAVVQPLFPIAGFLLVMLLPVLTMRSFAEEQRTGTLDVLRSIPVSPKALVAGKWLSAWLAALAVLAPSLLLPGLLSWWGDPDWGPVLTGFAGLALLAAAVSALGVLTSTFTDSQAVAAVVSLFVGVVLWFSYAAPTGDTTILGKLSLSERLRSFAGGALDSADTGFFVLLTLLALGSATVSVGDRRR